MTDAPEAELLARTGTAGAGRPRVRRARAAAGGGAVRALHRAEARRTVDWGGDPHNKAIAEREGDRVRLSPRKSFERWRETVRDRSEPWTAQELAEVGELRTHLLEALYARSRSIVRAAETLQRLMLTDPPESPCLRVGVRYVPAAREAQVGGDWYDVFAQPDGSTVVVIGDVVGHDTEAAADMAELRGLLRGIGLYTDGLVERRDQGFDEGVRRLAGELVAVRDRPLEAACEELLGRLLADVAEDDVALVAVGLRG